MHSRNKQKGPAVRTEVSERDDHARDDDDRPLDVTVDGDLPGSQRRIVVSMPARFVRSEERTVQAVVADAADAALIPPPAGPADGGGSH
jgi:hypothetical protein